MMYNEIRLSININKAHKSDVTELNWHGLLFDEPTNGQAGRAHWLTRRWA